MDSPGAKKIGLIIAGAMPPPSKLKRGVTDEGDGSDAEESDPADKADDMHEGASALGDMFDALRKGDKEEAYSAFKDAMDICMADRKAESKADDKSDGGDESDTYAKQ